MERKKAFFVSLKQIDLHAYPKMTEQSWGMKLGQKVAAIRSTGKYIENKKKRRQALETLGFVWRARAPSKEKAPPSQTTAPADP